MKIGLIAMSGVRACDRELLELGLTLPGFLERSKVIASLPSLGLLTLACLTPAEHEIQYVEVDHPQDFQPEKWNFDLAAISTFTAQALEAYDVADGLRGRGMRVVMGGLHVSACPQEAAAHCDAVAVGEGEITWPQVLSDAARGELKPIYQSAPAEFNLAQAPMPRFDLLDIERYNRLTVQTSRGCPLRCEFCASANLISSRYKQKPAAKVLAEIDAIKTIWPRLFIEFADDNSFVNKAYWRALLPDLARRKIRWFTETDVSVGEDEALLELMRQAGCVEVLVGLESPSEGALSGLELASDWKHKRFHRYRQSVHNIQSHGIRVNGCFIVGLDGHGPEVFDQTYDFARELELFDVQITLPTAFPGTPFYERLLREKRILEDRAWNKCTLFDVNFKPAQMEAQELAQGFRKLAVRLYSQDITDWRRENFHSKYLHAAEREVIS